MMTELAAAGAGLVVGVFLGHRYTVGRERRREFNYYSDGLFNRLEKQRKMVLDGVYPSDARAMDHTTFAEVKHRAPFYRRKRFSDAIDNYVEARDKCGYTVKGIYQFNKPETLLRAIDRLQEFLPHR